MSRQHSIPRTKKKKQNKTKTWGMRTRHYLFRKCATLNAIIYVSLSFFFSLSFSLWHLKIHSNSFLCVYHILPCSMCQGRQWAIFQRPPPIYEWNPTPLERFPIRNRRKFSMLCCRLLTCNSHNKYTNIHCVGQWKKTLLSRPHYRSSHSK